MECTFCERWPMIIISPTKSPHDNVYITAKRADEWPAYGHPFIYVYIIGWCGKMLRIGNDVRHSKYWAGISLLLVFVFVHRNVFSVPCYSFNDGLIRTSIQNSNEHHVANDVTAKQLAPLLSLCCNKYFRGSFWHTGGREFVVISSKNIAALSPHSV